MRNSIILFIIFFCIPVLGHAATLKVPTQYPTIQAAINAASGGDTVLVAPGTYVENIDFKGKAITVMGEKGAGVTIIDGGNPSNPNLGSVAMFQSGESQGAVLEGFTIRNGSGKSYSIFPYGYCMGGGILCSGSSPTIIDNVIIDNKVSASGFYGGSGYGAGIYCEGSSPVIVNNLIYENTGYWHSNSWADGGGIYCDEYSHPIITNTTITKNIAAAGGGISCEIGSKPIITNSILWNNIGEYETGYGDEIYATGIELTYCLIKNGTGNEWYGEGCIDSNPYFLDPYTKDLHIVNFSLCRNAGKNDAPGIPTKDFEGDDRILEGTVDIGADEFSSLHGSSGTYYIPGDFNTIQEAIDTSFPLDTFIVNPGTYKEEINFKGKAITLKSKFGPEVTMILGDNQEETIVSFKEGEGEDSVLDGFIIQEGLSGIRCFNSSPWIINNIINANKNGITCTWNSSPIITANTISNNSNKNLGGGIICDKSSPFISNNLITGNSAVGYSHTGKGGAIYSDSSDAIISNNVIQGNTSSEYGGAIYCRSESNIIISNNIIVNNSAIAGGGIYCQGSAIITNNSIIGNTATGQSKPGYWGGGGIYCNIYPKIIVTNTILWNNTSPYGPQISLEDNSCTLTISNSDVEGGQSSVFIYGGSTLNWGPGMIDVDPLFVDVREGDFHLPFTSPCKDTGDNSAVKELFDFEGDPRIAYGTVDMGADEFYTHLYWIGDATPGGNVEIKLVGLPGTSPVFLWVGSGVLGAPIPTMYGNWHLDFPILLSLGLGPIFTPEGISVLPYTFDSGFPAMDIPIQALIGAELTNLSVLEVK